MTRILATRMLATVGGLMLAASAAAGPWGELLDELDEMEPAEESRELDVRSSSWPIVDDRRRSTTVASGGADWRRDSDTPSASARSGTQRPAEKGLLAEMADWITGGGSRPDFDTPSASARSGSQRPAEKGLLAEMANWVTGGGSRPDFDSPSASARSGSQGSGSGLLAGLSDRITGAADSLMGESGERNQRGDRVQQDNSVQELLTSTMRKVPIYSDGEVRTLDRHMRDANEGRESTPVEMDPVGSGMSILFDPSTDNIAEKVGANDRARDMVKRLNLNPFD